MIRSLRPRGARLLPALLAINLTYPFIVVLERILSRAGNPALRFAWPRLSPSLGDVLQWGLLAAAVVVALRAAALRHSMPTLLLGLAAGLLLAVHVFHPHLYFAPSPLPQAARLLFPTLSAEQGQKLLAGVGIWLVLAGLVLLSISLAQDRIERRMAKLVLAALGVIGVLGGLGDYLGMLLEWHLFAAGTLFGLLEESSELCGASLMLLAAARLARHPCQGSAAVFG